MSSILSIILSMLALHTYLVYSEHTPSVLSTLSMLTRTLTSTLSMLKTYTQHAEIYTQTLASILTHPLSMLTQSISAYSIIPSILYHPLHNL